MTAPVAVGALGTQTSAPGDVVSLEVAPYLTDADAAATRSYSATGLPTGLSINTSTGAIAGTPSVGGTYNPIITFTTSDGASASITFEMVVASAPAAAQTFYVNGSTGNDSWDGESATFTSGSNGPWRTITRANSVQPHASGHVDIMVAPGTYRNQTYTPQYSGTDNTHRIRLRVASDGVVEWLGPSSGKMVRALQIGNDSGTSRSYISILRDSSARYFRWDGEVTFGSGGLAKGSDVAAYGHMDKLGYFNGTGIVVEGVARRTVGYDAMEFGTCPGFEHRIDVEQHGTPYYSDGNDWGDWFRINGSGTFFFDGGANGRAIYRSGHSPGLAYGGQGMVYRYAFNGRWGGNVSTFATTDGNRSGPCTARNARYWHIEQSIVGQNGYPPDNSPAGAAELMKLEGRDNCLGDSILCDSVQQGFFCDSGDWSGHMSGNRICHTVFQNFGGPVITIRDYLDDGAPGSTRVNDFQVKNCIIDRVLQNTISNWTDLVCQVVLSTGVNWQNVLFMHGITIRDQTRDLDSLFINFERGNGIGKRSIQYLLDNYPANFSNWTVTSSSLFTSERTFGTSIMPTDIATYFTPSTTANGVNLTLANGAGSSSTTLVVDDARWFVDPQFGTAPEVHIAGVGNRAYTAINYATNTLTLSSSASWSDNAAVNRSITSGSTPNRGAVR